MKNRLKFPKFLMILLILVFISIIGYFIFVRYQEIQRENEALSYFEEFFKKYEEYRNKSSEVIDLVDVSCNNGKITIILSNTGNATIPNSDLNVYIADTVKSKQFNFNPNSIPPNTTAVAISSDIYEIGKYYQVTVSSPSNVIMSTVWC